jgi:plastocyanin
VSIVDFGFSPGTVTIAVGDTVRWTNDGAVAHTTNGAGAWDSGTMGPEATFSRTFDTAGTFNYVCGIHGSMTGMVIVNS